MTAPIAQNADTQRVSRLIVPWFGLGASAGFLLWIILSSPGELQQVPVGLRRYLFFLSLGLAASGVVCAVLWFRRAWHVAARLNYLSCIFYFGFLKVLGWKFIPWALVAVSVAGFFRHADPSIENRWSLLLLHAMGSLAGLYMAFHLGDFLRPWGAFAQVAGSLWLLIVNLLPF